MLKFAAFDVLSAELYPGANRGDRRALVQVVGRALPGMSNHDGRTAVVFKQAHRHNFAYDPRPGFLYVRSRAISSRCNDNFDEFPAGEIREAYRTFVGKPVFVNHKNENHRRARGVIIDAALHEDTNPDGSPDTWIEVLMEVDAVHFPKLAQAILAGEIDRTSMGTDVAYSVCSFCGNKATTPIEYCAHIPRLKGRRIRRTTASGQQEDVLVREICHGLRFFENSLLVEEPADPTAFTFGVDDRGLRASASLDAQAGPRHRWVIRTPDGKELSDTSTRPYTHAVIVLNGEPKGAWEQANRPRGTWGYWSLHSDYGRAVKDAESVRRGVADPGLPDMRFEDVQVVPVEFPDSTTAARSIAYGETVAPADVDTLRDENCPVCGEADSYDGDKCMVCGFIKPPDEFMDPDLEKARQTDLRQQQDDSTAGEGDLKCDNCGKTFQSDESKGGAPAFIPPKASAAGQTLKGDDPRLPKSKESAPDEASDADDPGTAPAKGDVCPACGEGTLQPVSDTSAPDPPSDKPTDQDRADDEDEKDDEDDADGKGKPPWMKDKKKGAILSTATRVRPSGDAEQKEQSMRPALAALAEQQRTIDRQNRRIGALEGVLRLLTHAAGVAEHPRVASLLRVADENNPAQPVPAPPSEAPAATTEETLGDLNDADVEAVGVVPGATDVAPDATTSLDAGGTVLDVPLDLNEQDVEAPVAGTEGPRPLSEVKTETEVRAGDGQEDVSFPLEPFMQERRTTGSSPGEPRTFAAMRLARLRIQAGVEQATDDLALATQIAGGEMTDESIQTEIDTLSRVLHASASRQAQRTVPRSLVPRSAAAVGRTVPSMQNDPVVPIQSVANGPTEDEFLFE